MAATSVRSDFATASAAAAVFSQDRSNNYTSFICISKKLEIYPGADKTSLMLVLPQYRPFAALGGAALFLALGAAGLWDFTLMDAARAVDFNVLLMMAGTMGTVALFIESKMPARLAEMLIVRVPDVRWAVCMLALFAGVISAFVDNVTTVLMVAPVGLAIARKLKISPVPVIIAIAVSSNLQGAATLVGDTTSILLGGFAKMNFFDFFWMEGRPGIFFAGPCDAEQAQAHADQAAAQIRRSEHCCPDERRCGLPAGAVLFRTSDRRDPREGDADAQKVAGADRLAVLAEDADGGDHGSVAHERAAHGEHLLLAAGKRTGDLVLALFQTREDLIHALEVALDAVLVVAKVGADLEVFIGREVCKDLTPLRHLAHAELDDLVRKPRFTPYF